MKTTATRRGMAAALLALGLGGCGELQNPSLVTLDQDDGIPPVNVDGEVLAGVGTSVAACTGSDMVGDYTVDYVETADGGCLVTFNDTVEIFDEASARAANKQLGNQPILGINAIRLRVMAFSLADAANGAAFDTGPGNVSSLELVVDGVLLDADLNGPFPEEVALGEPTVDKVSDSVGSGMAANSDLDLRVTLTPAGRSSFPTDLAITFNAQPEVDLAVALN
ncbi:MAG TPA: hypothetical protein VG389_25670 [Myxococcota bacterium]|nr:hypothetical protein [Myxococcota bacterium]